MNKFPTHTIVYNMYVAACKTSDMAVKKYLVPDYVLLCPLTNAYAVVELQEDGHVSIHVKREAEKVWFYENLGICFLQVFIPTHPTQEDIAQAVVCTMTALISKSTKE